MKNLLQSCKFWQWDLHLPQITHLTSDYANQIFTWRVLFRDKHTNIWECSWEVMRLCNLQLSNFTSPVCHFQMGPFPVFSEFNLVWTPRNKPPSREWGQCYAGLITFRSLFGTHQLLVFRCSQLLPEMQTGWLSDKSLGVCLRLFLCNARDDHMKANEFCKLFIESVSKYTRSKLVALN